MDEFSSGSDDEVEKKDEPEEMLSKN